MENIIIIALTLIMIIGTIAAFFFKTTMFRLRILKPDHTEKYTEWYLSAQDIPKGIIKKIERGDFAEVQTERF